ncbi:hypothetical protein [Microlunatus soli]|uniref:Uncharacterized protein n=1 Tax=Microlunatus soli TaxID=630515 RepID=A0A1H1X967_9ACTN|nr:hypothetical protein [Microlunatus soli]SDT05824.1 hypothetical protein SAMN04489812_3982 [Microlunatus soli]
MKGLRAIWPNLPVLLAGSVLVGLGWSATRVVAGLSGWLIPIAVWLFVLPPLITLVVGCRQLLRDEHFGIGTLFRALPSNAGRTIMISAGPMLMVVLTLIGWHAWRLSGSALLLPSFVAGCLLSAAALLAGVVAVPYGVLTRVPGKETWLVAAFVLSRQPIPVLAVVAATALGVWAAAYLSFALIILLPGPLAMIWAAAVEQATVNSKKTLVSKGTR